MKIDVLQKNLEYIDLEVCSELLDLFLSNLETQEYIENQYLSLMNKWQQAYPRFEIPSGMIGIRINDNEYYYPIGRVNYTKDTIFDIASMSKLYTEFMLFAFLEEYHLSLDTKVKELTERYTSIQNMTIMDLLSFKSAYRTKIDIRDCTNINDAIEALRTVYTLEEKEGYYLYTDLPIMILTDLMEMYSGNSYKELFDKYIVHTYRLNDTYLEIDSDRYVTVNKGMCNDPKANIMGGYYGHAGVKTTCKDFMKFLSCALDSKYAYLLVTPSKALDINHQSIDTKALIGNSNISNFDDTSLASRYLSKNGFAIQGSVRCHGETMKMYIGEKEYTVTSCIFLDLYTQVENIKKYEKETGKVLTKEYVVDDYGSMMMCDVRSLLSYSGVYKELTNLVGRARLLELYRYLNDKRV